MDIPYQQLSDDTLEAILEEFDLGEIRQRFIQDRSENSGPE